MHSQQAKTQVRAQQTEEQIGQVMGLVGQRHQLVSELEDIQRRRLEIAKAITGAVGDEKGVLRQQAQQLDRQISGAENALRAIETIIAQQTGGAAPAVPATPAVPAAPVIAGGSGFAYSTAPSDPVIPMKDAMTFGAMGFALVALAGVAVFTAVRKFRRDTYDAVSQLRSELWDEMKKVSVGVDAIAVELERIGEGQRYVTKALSEKKEPAPPAPRGVSS